jgi:polysaccharide biosynthesis protein PslA
MNEAVINSSSSMVGDVTVERDDNSLSIFSDECPPSLGALPDHQDKVDQKLSTLKSIKISAWIIEALFRFSDGVAILGAGFVALYIFDRSIGIQFHSFYIKTLIIGTVVSLLYLEWRFTYYPEANLNYWLAAKRIFSAGMMAVMTFLVLSFMFKISEIYSRLWFATWLVCGAAWMLGVRSLLMIFINHWKKQGAFDLRVAIVGAGHQGVRLIDHLKCAADLRIKIVGIYDDRFQRLQSAATSININGCTDALFERIRKNEIDQVIIALPWSAESRMHSLARRFAMTPVSIRLAPDLAGFSFTERHYSLVGGLPFLNLFDRPISGFSWFLKSVEDRVLAAICLLILSPIMLICALAVKLNSTGPVFFRQNRVGFNNRVIRIWKFRSMYHDKCQADKIRQATRNDSRITSVGRFLRKTSLDELPQLFNVMMGEMSLVGPRPHAESTTVGDREFHRVVDSYGSRHRVKPGLTGWAQVNGWRGETDTEEKLIKRLEHDLYYIENWSILFDFYILLRTAAIAFNQRNAF